MPNERYGVFSVGTGALERPPRGPSRQERLGGRESVLASVSMARVPVVDSQVIPLDRTEITRPELPDCVAAYSDVKGGFAVCSRK